MYMWCFGCDVVKRVAIVLRFGMWLLDYFLLTSQTFNLQDQEKTTSSGPNPFNSDT